MAVMLQHWTAGSWPGDAVSRPSASTVFGGTAPTPIYEALVREWSSCGRTVPGRRGRAARRVDEARREDEARPVPWGGGSGAAPVHGYAVVPADPHRQPGAAPGAPYGDREPRADRVIPGERVPYGEAPVRDGRPYAEVPVYGSAAYGSAAHGSTAYGSAGYASAGYGGSGTAPYPGGTYPGGAPDASVGVDRTFHERGGAAYDRGAPPGGMWHGPGAPAAGHEAAAHSEPAVPPGAAATVTPAPPVAGSAVVPLSEAPGQRQPGAEVEPAWERVGVLGLPVTPDARDRRP